jgi:hypothetical protein
VLHGACPSPKGRVRSSHDRSDAVNTTIFRIASQKDRRTCLPLWNRYTACLHQARQAVNVPTLLTRGRSAAS